MVCVVSTCLCAKRVKHGEHHRENPAESWHRQDYQLKSNFRDEKLWAFKHNFRICEAREPNLFLPVFFAIILGFCSALVAISDLGEYGQCLQVGIYAVIAAVIFLLLSRKAKYTVRIENPVSQIIVLETDDRAYAEKVVGALNKAIESFDAAPGPAILPTQQT